MAPKTKREQDTSDDFISDDDAPKSKRAKSSASASKATLPGGGVSEGDGNAYWELTPGRRVTVSKFKGKTMVGIREYYQKDGVSLPGKKGISMPPEQLDAFIRLLPHLEAVLKSHGVVLARPDYAGRAASHEKPSGDDGDDEEADDSEAAAETSKKKNFEETSDEE